MFMWYVGWAREMEIRHEVEKWGGIRNELAILEGRTRGPGRKRGRGL